MAKSALIIGVGDGLSASLARLLHAEGYALHLGARTAEKMAHLVEETGATAHLVNGTDAAAVEALVDGIADRLEIAIYNPSARVRGPITEIDPDEARKPVDVTAIGSMILGQAAAQKMLTQDPDADTGAKGTILFTGASAGVKGFPQSATFAMGKFAQRGLSQSMSRELHPQGVHVAWVNIDGGIASARYTPDTPDAALSPDAIAQSYLALARQHRSAWSEELSVRPYVERF